MKAKELWKIMRMNGIPFNVINYKSIGEKLKKDFPVVLDESLVKQAMRCRI